jgi:hypothetical protein
MLVGDRIDFNKYEWRVLDIRNNTALIITENIIGQRAYHDRYTDVTWADCELRKYLNGEFYEKFSSANKPRIIPVTNKNPVNPWYGAKGGDDTLDSIFLLTIEDVVCKYFGDSSIRLQNRVVKIKNIDIKKKMKTTVNEWQHLEATDGGGGFGLRAVLIVLPHMYLVTMVV